MIKVLYVADILQMMKEEYSSHLMSTMNELKIYQDKGEGSGMLISPELKIRHKDSGLLYTVDAIGMEDITLRTPDGQLFPVKHDEFEKNYELD